MSNTIAYNLIAGNINLIPMRGVSFYDHDNSEGTHFFQLERESTWRMTRIEKNCYLGGSVTIGWKVEAQLYVAHNCFNMYLWQLNERLEKLRNRYINTQILLGQVEPPSIDPQSEWKYYPPENPPYFTYPLQNDIRTKVINSTSQMVVDFGNNLIFSFEYEQVPERPRLIIRLSGVMRDSVDISFPGKETLTDVNKYIFK